MATQDKSVSIAPYFKIHSGKMREVKALCERFIEKSKTEPGCLYYGFSFNGDVIFCREGYQDAEAALANLRAAVDADDDRPTVDTKDQLGRASHRRVPFGRRGRLTDRA